MVCAADDWRAFYSCHFLEIHTCFLIVLSDLQAKRIYVREEQKYTFSELPEYKLFLKDWKFLIYWSFSFISYFIVSIYTYMPEIHIYTAKNK